MPSAQFFNLATWHTINFAYTRKALAEISDMQRQGLSATTAFAYASMARVQMELGQKDEARKSYQKFFDLWKDADPDVPLLIQTRDAFNKYP